VSKLCDQVISTLKEIFPQAKIRVEEYVLFRNQRLFLDIFMPQFGIVIEVHGRQHDEFVEHFHGNAQGFREAKRRDSLKEEWIAEKGYTLVALRAKELPISKDELLERIDVESNPK
jgi:very-short-patch-repair endonuclease